MDMNDREIWAVLHGAVFGGLLFLGFVAAAAGLWNLDRAELTPAGVSARVRRLSNGLWAMAILAWLAALTGTWVVFPWYMEDPSLVPALLASPGTSAWQTFAMEWKSHVAWLAPMLLTTSAAVVSARGASLASDKTLRRVVVGALGLALATAAAAGTLGALITRVAPVR
jgi:hypothetical protein